MRETCLHCPFSFGYPSEQSLWTAYPFTAINNSLPLSFSLSLSLLTSPPPKTSLPPPQLHHHHISRSYSSKAICFWVRCLGLSPPSLSPLSLWTSLRLTGPQFITWQAQMSALPFPSSRYTPHIHKIPLCFQTVTDFMEGRPVFFKACVLWVYSMAAANWSKAERYIWHKENRVQP